MQQQKVVEESEKQIFDNKIEHELLTIQTDDHNESVTTLNRSSMLGTEKCEINDGLLLSQRMYISYIYVS